MLGIGTNPPGFERLIAGQPELVRLIDGRAGLHFPLSPGIFEGISWTILGQQVNLAFTYRLRRNLAKLCGQPTSDGLIAHPTAEAVAQLDYADLTQLQFSRRKAEYLIDTARMMVAGQLTLDPLAPASQVEKQLLAVRGFGKWSTHYVMMRVLGFADCIPLGDTGLTSALQQFYELDHRPDTAETVELMKPFAPYRSLATYHLWTSLGGNPV
jgi:AraC family transcriptional regulator of adaptative response / DNA-3-methyladenine glycosylase II